MSIKLPSSKQPEVFLGANFLVVNGPPFVIYDILNEKKIFETEIPVTAPVISDDESTTAWFTVDETDLKRRNRNRQRRRAAPAKPLKPILCVMDLTTGKIAKSKKLDFETIQEAAISPDGRRIVSLSWPSSETQLMTVWNAANRSEISRITEHVRSKLAVQIEGLKRLCIKPNGTQCFTSREFKLWDFRSNSCPTDTRFASTPIGVT